MTKETQIQTVLGYSPLCWLFVLSGNVVEQRPDRKVTPLASIFGSTL